MNYFIKKRIILIEGGTTKWDVAVVEQLPEANPRGVKAMEGAAVAVVTV
jgi:hypothetical protein